MGASGEAQHGFSRVSFHERHHASSAVCVLGSFEQGANHEVKPIHPKDSNHAPISWNLRTGYKSTSSQSYCWSCCGQTKHGQSSALQVHPQPVQAVDPATKVYSVSLTCLLSLAVKYMLKTPLCKDSKLVVPMFCLCQMNALCVNTKSCYGHGVFNTFITTSCMYTGHCTCTAKQICGCCQPAGASVWGHRAHARDSSCAHLLTAHGAVPQLEQLWIDWRSALVCMYVAAALLLKYGRCWLQK